MSDEHLHSAARALEQILGARHPQSTFTVTVQREPGGAADRERKPGAGVRRDQQTRGSDVRA